jgi:hypothetical protein
MASFTGAAGETNVDTTNNRIVVQDGITAGGWPAARLSEIGGGFLNKFRNGTMDVWQRGTSALTATTSGAHTADGWIVLPTGASVTAAQAGGRLVTKNSLQVTGASSVTDLIIKQRIESLMAAAFCSQTVTVQAQIYNGSGGSMTPKLTVNRPSAQDNYGSVTADLNAVSLQACPASAWTLVSYTFAANAASYNGLEIGFDFGNNFGANTKTVQIAECDIRVTPGLAAGVPISAAPPPPELRPVGIETSLCQRYYWRNLTGLSFGSYSFGACSSTTSASFFIQYPELMRAVPTINQSNTAVTFNFGAANAATSLGAVQAGPMTAFVPVNVASGLTANTLANWINNNNTAGYVEATAEL